MLLNSKSILNCNEEEEKEHNNEIEEISKMIYSLPNYDCAIIIKYVDKAKEKRELPQHPLNSAVFSCFRPLSAPNELLDKSIS